MLNLQVKVKTLKTQHPKEGEAEEGLLQTINASTATGMVTGKILIKLYISVPEGAVFVWRTESSILHRG